MPWWTERTLNVCIFPPMMCCKMNIYLCVVLSKLTYICVHSSTCVCGCITRFVRAWMCVCVCSVLADYWASMPRGFMLFHTKQWNQYLFVTDKTGWPEIGMHIIPHTHTHAHHYCAVVCVCVHVDLQGFALCVCVCYLCMCVIHSYKDTIHTLSSSF